MKTIIIFHHHCSNHQGWILILGINWECNLIKSDPWLHIMKITEIYTQEFRIMLMMKTELLCCNRKMK